MEMKPGYKQTEVGVIPENWEVKPLHMLADKIMVGIASAATHAYRDRGIVMFRNQNIKPGYLDDSDVLYIAEDYEETFKNKRLKPGDLLTARTGYPGTTSIVPPQYAGAQSFTTLITRPRRDEVDSAYLCCFINSEAGQKYFEQNQAGGGQKNVNARSLKNLLVPLPPTKIEQEAIAESLSDADALIESLEQLTVKKRHLKQGAMQELLTGKKRLSACAGEWKIVNIGDFTDCAAGGTPSTLVPSYWGGSIPWMSSGELSRKFVSEASGRITEQGLDNCSAKIIPKKCVLVGLAGQGKTRGTVAINLVELCTNQSIAAILPSPAFVPEYLYYNLDMRYDELRELSAGDGGRGGLNLTIIKGLSIPLPPINEQTSIAATLCDMDAEIAALEAKLTKACQIKQGMMQELLTGRIRLISPPAKVTEIKAAAANNKKHNWQINEAVIIGVLANHFGSENFPLTRKRCTKLTYLLHRHAERKAEGYLKKVAGPYNPATRYKGPEAIAQKNKYMRLHNNGTYLGFVSAEKVSAAETYFQQWYGQEMLPWLEKFRRETTDKLELITTVDMAMEDLCREDKPPELATVKQVIQTLPEWEAKLEREIFSDKNISWAIEFCKALFP